MNDQFILPDYERNGFSKIDTLPYLPLIRLKNDPDLPFRNYTCMDFNQIRGNNG
jgi:hypothetical protein